MIRRRERGKRGNYRSGDLYDLGVLCLISEKK